MSPEQSVTYVSGSDRAKGGGEGGIRTLGTLARTTVFETAPFDHSGISPRAAPESTGSEHAGPYPKPYPAASASPVGIIEFRGEYAEITAYEPT